MTSVKGRFAMDSRMLGDDGAEGTALGSLECPLVENVGVVGEECSERVEERER